MEMMVRRIIADLEEALGRNLKQIKILLIGLCPNWFTKPLGNIGIKISLIERALKERKGRDSTHVYYISLYTINAKQKELAC